MGTGRTGPPRSSGAVLFSEAWGQGWRECQSERVRWPGALLLGRWVNLIIRAMVSWGSRERSVYYDVYSLRGSGVMLFVCLCYIYSIIFLVRERERLKCCCDTYPPHPAHVVVMTHKSVCPWWSQLLYVLPICVTSSLTGNDQDP